MASELLAPKFIILYVFIVSTLYVHFRGKKRLSFSRQLTDHSTFMAPYNGLIYLFSAVPRTPVLDPELLPELKPLKDNWKVIRDEAMNLYEMGHIRSSDKHNDLAFNTFFKRGWKRFYLRWYDDFLPSAKELCPKTVELVQSIPTLNAAMFTLMSPRSKLGSHRDPFAGSLRYHLGLMTPNSEECRIFIDGTPHAWYDGEGILFDETYVHSVKNDTDETRVILFCDVARPLHTPVMRAINRFVTNHLVKVTASQNVETEKIGAMNRLAAYVFKARDFFIRMKKVNKPVYMTVRYLLIAGLVYVIFIAGLR